MAISKSTEFVEALKAPGRVPVIAELKLCDASGKALTAGRSVQDIVTAYLAGNAACLSVVTGKWFGGTADLLSQVGGVSDGRPILRKDFIASRSALEESRALGASAALLTVRLLRPGKTADLTETALSLGLTPFVEIGSQAEAAEVPPGMPGVLAINNADIATRERTGDGPSRSFALFHAARARRPAALVSASRISDEATASALLRFGFDGLLMCTALMNSDNLLANIAHRVAHDTRPGRLVRIIQ